MRNTRWSGLLGAALIAGVVTSCDDPTRPTMVAEIAPHIALVQPDSITRASLVLPLTAVRARSIGPTGKVVDLVLQGTTWRGSLTGLTAGTYEVIIEGIANGQVQFYGRLATVSVARGERAQPSIPFAAAVPTVTNPTLNNTTNFSQRIPFATIAAATGYVVQISQDNTFASGVTEFASADTNPLVTVTQPGTWYIRSRAVLPQVTATSIPWSDTRSWIVIEANGGDDATDAATVTLVPEAPQTIASRNITPTKREDWFEIDVREGDSLFVETFAARLAFASALNTTLTLFESDGTTQVAQNLDAPGTTDSRLVYVAENTDTYKVRVGATGSTSGHYELETEIRRLPEAPSGLTVTILSGTEVRLDWNDESDNETSFRVERCEGAACTVFAEVTSTASDIETLNESALTQGSTYKWRIRARNNVGNSAYTSEVVAALVGPTAPTGVAATTVSATQINVTWTDAATNETGYEVERCTGAACTNFTQLTTLAAGATAFSDNAVAYNNTYRYQIRATNSVVPSAYSTIVEAHTIPPTTPTGFAAVVAGPTTINLSWTDASSDETFFLIERCTGDACSSFAVIDSVAAGVTAYASTVVYNTGYRFRIRARNAVVSQTATAIVNADTRPPTAPTALGATTESATAIALLWTDNSDDETGFRVERCDTPGCTNFTLLTTVLADIEGYTDNTATVGNTYRYRVIAVGVPGNSAESNIADANTLVPSGPTSLAAQTITASVIRLTWTDNANNETGYRLDRCTGAACTPTTQLAVFASGVVTFDDSTAQAGQTYSYRLYATNAAGLSTGSNTTGANTNPPATPTALVATTVSGSRIDLEWTNNAPEATEMRIERCTGVGCSDFVEIDVVAAAQTTYQNIGGTFPVLIDSSYTYRIRAQNAADVSTYSTTATAHTFSPTAPVSLSATTDNGGQISLTWSASTPDITGYEIQRCDFAGCTNFAFLAGTDASAFLFVDASVSAEGDWAYRVRGVNIVGPGAFSPVATANTRTPATPTGLTATVLVNLVRLNWTDAADNEQRFVIERCDGAACSPTDYDTVATVNTTTWDDSLPDANKEYTYRVRTENAVGASAPTAGAVANTLIADPVTVLSAVSVSPTQINLSWTQSASQGTGLVTGYVIYYCAGVCDPTVTPTTLATTLAAASSYEHTGLTAGTDFTYTVVPVTAFGATPIAGGVTAYASTAVPAAPSGFTATLMSPTSIQLNWTDNATDETEFELAQCSGVGCTNFAVVETLGVDANAFLADTLTFNTEYRFIVRAVNTAGSSAWTDTISIGTTVPAVPTSAVAVISTFDTNIQLFWNDVSDDETSFEIDVCQGDGCTTFALDKTVGANITSEYMGNAPPQIFRLRVRAVNAAGSSLPSNEVQITGGAPYAAPTGTIATTTGPASITLTWTDQTDNETNFLIYRCTGVGCDPMTGVVVDSVPRDSTTFEDATVSTGELYEYAVVASNGAGTAASVAFPAHTVAPGAPTGLNATALSNTHIALAWNDGGPYETSNVIERCEGASCSGFTPIDTLPANFISYNDTGLSANVTYRYRVKAVNAVASSGYSNIAEKVTDLPTAPTVLSALAMTTTRIDLAWTDNANNEEFYIVERCAGVCDENGAFAEIETGLAPNAATYSDVTVLAGQAYSYRVRALNAGGVSPYTNIAAAVTAVPNDPTALTATTLSGTLIELSWTDNASNELSYQVERCASAACPTFTLRKTLAAGTTSYTDTVAVDDVYTYRVRAVNNVGASGYTSEESASALRPSAASDLTVSTISATRIDLSWTDNATTEDGYVVERCSGAGCSDFTVRDSLTADATSYQDDGIATETSFTYRVYAYNVAGPSDVAGPLTATTITPAAPTALAAVLAAPGQINLSWTDNANNEIQYRVERCSAGATKCATSDSMNVYAVEVATLGMDANSHADAGLAPSTLYFYRVRATNIAGSSLYSAIVSRSTSVPPAPSALTALTVLGTRIDLTWTDNSANEEGFRVERCIGPDPCGVFTQIAQLAAGTTSHQDSTLTPGQEVTYRVLSFNGGGGNASGTASATTIVPATPSALLAQASGQTQMNVSWTDNATDEAGYYLERCSGDGCSSFVPLDTLAANAIGFTDLTVTADNIYRYRVRAFGNGSSEYSAISSAATTLPNPVTGLVATAISDTRVDLSWTDNTPTDSLWNEVSFAIYRCTGDACTPAAFHIAVGSDTTVFVDSALTPGLTYGYLVVAQNNAGQAVASNVAYSATTVPAIPTALSDSTVSATEVLLSWADNAGNETGYEIERCEGGGCSNFAAVDTAGVDATSFTVGGLAGGTTYQFRIRAFNTNGSSGYSNVVSAQSDVPPAPTALSGATVSASQVNLTWTDNAENETAYIIERCDGAGCGVFVVIDSLAAGTTTYQDATIAIDTTYVYQVRASNAAGASGYTSTVTVSTYRPATPTTLVALPISATRVDLTWTDVAANDTVIIVERCLGNGCSVFTDIAAVAPNATSYSDMTVTVNNTYNYRLRAENAAGASASTDSVEVGTFIPSDPSGLTASTDSPTQITLNWTDNANTENDFLIERCAGIGCAVFDSLFVVAADETSYADTSVTLGTSYTYQIIARGGGGNSAPSMSATAHTFPAGAVATVTSAPLTATTLQLSWDAADFATLYQIDTVSGGDTTLFAVVSAGVTDTVVTVPTGQVYNFVVRASNNAGAGAYAGTSIAMTPPPAPVGLTAFPLSTSQTSLAWSDTTNRETGFEVERAFFNAGTFGAFVNVATLGADVTSEVNTVPAPTGRYKYRVRAVNQIGAGDYSNEVDLTLTGPAAPTGLTANVTAPGQITLNWFDNSDAEQSFSVERSVGNNVSYAQIASLGAGVTSMVDSSGISINTAYYYRVRAVNNIGASPFSNESNTTTTVPGAVLSIGSVIQSSTSIQIAWNGSGTVGESGFRIYRCIGGGCTDFTLLDGSLPPDAATYVDATATYGTQYRYQARPYNIAGEPIGNPVNDRLLILPTPTSNLVALPTDRTSIRFKWNPGVFTWETGFEVEQCDGFGCSDFEPLATVAANDSMTVSTGLAANGVWHRYRVRAVADGNLGPWSPLVYTHTPKEVTLGDTLVTATVAEVNSHGNMTHYVVTMPAGSPTVEVTIGDDPNGTTTNDISYLLMSRSKPIERPAGNLAGLGTVGDTLCAPGTYAGPGTTVTCSLPHLGAPTDYYITTYSLAYNNLRISALPGPTTYTFTNCTQTGRLGPSQGQCDASYGATSLSGQVTVAGSGFQDWQVPFAGRWAVTAVGAAGAAAEVTVQGGRGAQIYGEFNFTQGQNLRLAVGQLGLGVASGGNGGGGGGSFLYDFDGSTPLLIAAGGGGTRGAAAQDGCDASVTTFAIVGSGGSPTSPCTVKVGGAGLGGLVSSFSWGSGGAGFNSYGQGDFSTTSAGGSSWANLNVGGIDPTFYAAHGGFGGGGSGYGQNGGGGGGGYSGGDGGWIGGGGGSFNSGANQAAVPGVGTAHGYVILKYLGPL